MQTDTPGHEEGRYFLRQLQGSWVPTSPTSWLGTQRERGNYGYKVWRSLHTNRRHRPQKRSVSTPQHPTPNGTVVARASCKKPRGFTLFAPLNFWPGGAGGLATGTVSSTDKVRGVYPVETGRAPRLATPSACQE